MKFKKYINYKTKLYSIKLKTEIKVFILKIKASYYGIRLLNKKSKSWLEISLKQYDLYVEIQKIYKSTILKCENCIHNYYHDTIEIK